MSFEPTSIADLSFVLASWSAGLLLACGALGVARVPGPGFTWVVAPVAGLIGLAPAFDEGAWWARIGLALIAVAMLWARNRPFAGVVQIGAGIAFLIQAAMVGGVIPACSATAALGGVTSEMLLGHWYLVDPRLPRFSLRFLAGVGIAGLVADSAVVASSGLPGGGATLAYWVLMATSILLMVAVIAALRYPAYSGVMSATGLSYLAVLTTLGGVFLGRALVAGLGPFAS